MRVLDRMVLFKSVQVGHAGILVWKLGCVFNELILDSIEILILGGIFLEHQFVLTQLFVLDLHHQWIV